MKKILVMALLFCFVSAGVAIAATLDELNKPLLNKGQWRTDQIKEIGYSDNESRNNNFTSPTYSDESGTEFAYQPHLYYGLSDTLQLSAQGSFFIPHKTIYTTYLESGGATSMTTNKPKYSNWISENLTWRPNQSWELYFIPIQFFGKNKSHSINFGPIDTGMSTNLDITAFSFSSGLTWLSNPQPGNKTTNNRADLDGLINPLLDKGQVELSLGMTTGWEEQKAKANMDPPLSPLTFGRIHAKARDYNLTLYPRVTFGILNNLQIDLLTQFEPAFLNYGRQNSSQYMVVGPTVLETYSEQKDKVVSSYNPELTLTQRPHPQFEWYVQGQYGYDKTRENRVSQNYTGGILTGTTSSTSRYTSKELEASIGATWISKPKNEGRPLAADLDGLKNPLLERNQVRADLSFEARRMWSKQSDGTSTRISNCSVSATVTYGVLEALQAYLGFDLRPEYTYPADFGTFHGNTIYRASTGYRAGVTYRPKQSFELFAQVGVLPNTRYKNESFSSGVPTSVNNSNYLDVEVDAGATILW